MVIPVEGQHLQMPEEKLPGIPQITEGRRAGVLVGAELVKNFVAHDRRGRHEQGVEGLAQLLLLASVARHDHLLASSIQDADDGVETRPLRVHHTCETIQISTLKNNDSTMNKSIDSQ